MRKGGRKGGREGGGDGGGGGGGEVTYAIFSLKEDDTAALVSGGKILSRVIKLNCRDDIGYRHRGRRRRRRKRRRRSE